MRLFLRDECIRIVSVGDNDGIIWTVELEEPSGWYVGRTSKYPRLQWRNKSPEGAMEGIMELVDQVDAGGGFVGSERKLLTDGNTTIRE